MKPPCHGLTRQAASNLTEGPKIRKETCRTSTILPFSQIIASPQDSTETYDAQDSRHQMSTTEASLRGPLSLFILCNVHQKAEAAVTERMTSLRYYFLTRPGIILAVRSFWQPIRHKYVSVHLKNDSAHLLFVQAE